MARRDRAGPPARRRRSAATTAQGARPTGSASRTVGDLLRHYPRRYVERGELTDLAELRVGEHVTVLARSPSVERAASVTRPKRHRLEVVVTDGTRHG